MGNTILHIDTSDLQGLLNRMRGKLNQKEFYQVQYRALRRAGQRARTLVKDEVKVDYAPPAGYILGSISSPRISGGGGGVTCILDVSNSRGRIGPIYKATGGRTAKRRRKGGQVYASIVTAGKSALPNGGDRPHFRTGKGVYVRMAGVWGYNATVRYTTKTGTVKSYRVRKERIRPAVGIAVPQMPLNRSEARIQQNVERLLEERLIHECDVLLKGIV